MDQSIYNYYSQGTEEHHWWHVARRNVLDTLLTTFVPLPAAAHILDVGCGAGAEMAFFKKYGEVWGVDSEEQMIQACHKRGLNNATVSKGETLKFADNTFDLITCLDTLEHIEDEKKVLSEIQRVGKREGYVLITVPAGPFLFGPYDTTSGHFRRYSKKSLKTLLEKNNFKIVKLSYYNFFLYPPIALIRFLSKYLPIPAGSEKALKIPQKHVNRILTDIFAFESKILPNVNLPFGVSLVAIATYDQPAHARSGTGKTFS